MSIIFQTLNKLQASPREAPGAPMDAGGVPGSESSPGRRRPLVITGMVAGAFIILGFALIFGVRFLATHANGIGTEAAASQDGAAETSFIAFEEPVRSEIAVRDTAPHYLPPDSASQPVQPSGGETVGATTAVVSLPDPQVADTPKTPRAVPENRENRSEAQLFTATTAPAGQAAVPTGKSDALVLQMEAMGPTGENPSGVSEAMLAEQRKAEKARQAAREKNERISRLVSRLEAALSSASPDHHHIESLLNELAMLKQPGSPYVDKLRAYWLLKMEKYDQARALLEKLAAADEEDVEVGINLAVIDIRRGEAPAALARLQRLKKAHPENARIAELMRKLQ